MVVEAVTVAVEEIDPMNLVPIIAAAALAAFLSAGVHFIARPGALVRGESSIPVATADASGDDLSSGDSGASSAGGSGGGGH